MNPGEYNTRISFLKQQSGYDDYGEPVDAWNIYKSTWAKKFDFIGTDFYAAQSESSKIEVKFKCRYKPDITKDMRIQRGTMVYEIVGMPVDVDNKHAELLIYCKLVN